MAVIALVIGTSLSVSSTERVDASLVASGFAGWCFVPVIQLLTGLLLVRGTGQSRLRALERYFATHWPWSLWILATHAAVLIVPAARSYGSWLLLTAAIPALWTIRLLVALCREHLGLSFADARRRVAVHQAVSGAVIVLYVAVVVALWPRVIALL